MGLVASVGSAAAQQAAGPTVSDDSLLALYDGLRVADVSDGMDVVGRRDVSLMDPRIRPLWHDVGTMEHRVPGIAVTARYVPTGGSVRDTDEIIKQDIPLYYDLLQRGQGIRPGRNELESVQEPVEVGGVLVRPGDVVVADGDGVIVVPRQVAVPIAKAARRVKKSDQQARRRLYEQLGHPLDETVQP